MIDESTTPSREPSRPWTRLPWVCWTLLALNILVWLAMVIAGVDPMQPTALQLLEWGGNLGVLTLRGEGWRLVTSMFLHAGLVHLAFNAYFLWVVGRLTEQVFGAPAFAFLYFASGLIASVVSSLWQPEVVSVGASGALFGVFGGFLGFTLRNRDLLPREFVGQVYRNALVLIGLNLLIGLGVENIDLAAHVGGLIAGVGIGWLLATWAERKARQADQSR